MGDGARGPADIVHVDVADVLRFGGGPADHDRDPPGGETSRQRMGGGEGDQQDPVGMAGGNVALHPVGVGTRLDRQ